MFLKRHEQVLSGLSAFLSHPLQALLEQRLAGDPRDGAMNLFKKAVAEVPAYREFLHQAGIEPGKVVSFSDYQSLPLLTKANYIQAYSLPQRCIGGTLSACDRLAVSSGSTGVSTFWPRSMLNELDIALRFEQVFRQGFKANSHSSLALVCFPLGNWVGGVYTTSCCWYLAQKGYPVTVATPGNKPEEILRVIKELGSYFEQTVLLGYPPFVKDVIDTGKQQGIDWASRRIKMVFAGEVFSEEWRTLMGERVGSHDYCHDFASLYGTADAGVLGNETPVSIAIRRFLAQNPGAARELFGESRLPTLVQYDPLSRYFEVIDGTLVVSGDNGVPLVRYHIADQGGISTYQEMMAFLKGRGMGSLEEYGLSQDETIYPLPFVWVFGRADFTVSFYGANIYPENVVVGLEQAELSASVSGKFVMQIRHDGDGSEYLHITVELLPGIDPVAVLTEKTGHSIHRHLLRLNSEFANYVPAAKQIPRIELRAFGDNEYFPQGVKHRYTRR